MHCRRDLGREMKRESRAQRSQEEGMKRGPRQTGSTQRDCDDKRRPQLTSHVHAARREGGLVWETERGMGNVEMTGTQNAVGSKNDVQSGITTMGRDIGRVPGHPGMRLQDLVHNRQKTCNSLS